MAWTKHTTSSGRNFFKFEKKGDTLEGDWLGISDGKYGAIGTIATEEGERSFTLNAALKDLEDIERGTPIRLVMSGWAQTKNGYRCKTFDVFTETGGDDKFEATDRDVPF